MNTDVISPQPLYIFSSYNTSAGIDFSRQNVPVGSRAERVKPTFPANTKRSANVGLMLAHRLRRWPNIKPPLGQRLVFPGIVSTCDVGGGHRVVVSTAAFHARFRGSVPGLGGLKETKMFLPHPRVKVSIVGSICDREVACSASDRQGSNFESCVWRTVSSQSSHHPQGVLLAQFSLDVHKGGLKPDSFHFNV